MSKALPPILHRDEYTRQIELPLIAFFDEVIFAPLKAAIAGPDVRHNEAYGNLKSALLAHVVLYKDGWFTGRFSSAIGRELRGMGAKWYERGFKIDPQEIPVDLSNLLAASEARGKAMHQAALAVLLAVAENIVKAPTGIKDTIPVDAIHADLQKQFVDTTASVFGPEAPFTLGLQENLTEEMERGLDTGAVAAAVSLASNLRDRITKNLSEGARTDRLAAIVEAGRTTAKHKAAALAEAQTASYVASFREARYRDVGITEYVWSTSEDDKVRLGHRLLSGRVFSWGSPPVVDPSTGRRCHPGQDFNCRCVPLGIPPISS